MLYSCTHMATVGVKCLVHYLDCLHTGDDICRQSFSLNDVYTIYRLRRYSYSFVVTLVFYRVTLM